MMATLQEQIETIREEFYNSSTTEGSMIADMLGDLAESDLEKGEEKECIIASLREVINWAESAISKLTHGKKSVFEMVREQYIHDKGLPDADSGPDYGAVHPVID